MSSCCCEMQQPWCPEPRRPKMWSIHPRGCSGSLYIGCLLYYIVICMIYMHTLCGNLVTTWCLPMSFASLLSAVAAIASWRRHPKVCMAPAFSLIKRSVRGWIHNCILKLKWQDAACPKIFGSRECFIFRGFAITWFWLAMTTVSRWPEI